MVFGLLSNPSNDVHQTAVNAVSSFHSAKPSPIYRGDKELPADFETPLSHQS
jgi:hypothetical protein